MGETVVVIVNKNNKTVKWIVNGVQKASMTHNMIGGKDRLLFPFLEMKDK